MSSPEQPRDNYGRWTAGQNEAVRKQVIERLQKGGAKPESIAKHTAHLATLSGDALAKRAADMSVPRIAMHAAVDAAAAPPTRKPAAKSATPVTKVSPPPPALVTKVSQLAKPRGIAKEMKEARAAAAASGKPIDSEILRDFYERLRAMTNNDDVEKLAKQLGVRVAHVHKTRGYTVKNGEVRGVKREIAPMRKAIMEHLQTAHAPGGPDEHYQWMAPIGKPGMKVVVRKHPLGKWHDENGTLLPKAEQERINKMKIPPAWCGVRVAISSKADVLAFGYDGQGREQRKYNPNHA